MLCQRGAQFGRTGGGSDGFAVLNQPPDLGVTVGEGETLAAHRVPDISAVSDFLEELAAARAVHFGT